MKKPKKVTIDPWDQLVEAPRANVPEASRLATRALWLRFLIWAVMVGFVATALGMLVMASGLGKASQAGPAGDNSLVIATATRAMEAWLADDPAPMLSGRILTTDVVEPLEFDLPANAVPPTFSVSVVRFTLIDQLNQTYRAGIQVAVDPRGSAEAISTPSLEQIPNSANDAWATGPWPGLDTTAVPETVTSAIDAWAKAYAGGDPDALRLSVGDTDPNHWYTPLSWVQQAFASADVATALDEDETRLAVQVKLALVWVGQPLIDQANSTGVGNLPSITMDLLVERADTAAPVVTAWGPAGTGPTLTAFANAVDATARTIPTVAVPTGPNTSPSAGTPPSTAAPTVPSPVEPSVPEGEELGDEGLHDSPGSPTP